MKNKKAIIILFFLLAIVLVGYLFDLSKRANEEIILSSNARLPTLTFYTTSGATAPQLAFWAAYQSGELQKIFNVKVVSWKNTEQLKSFVLAGVGDLWLGHTEAFALAKNRGAPVQLLAISAWRKFYFVSKDPIVKSLNDLEGLKVGVTPPGGPAVSIVKAIMDPNKFSKIQFIGNEPEILFNNLKSNKIDGALIAEPFLAIIQSKLSEYNNVINIEQAFGDKFKTSPRLPLAGLAINSNFVKKHPQEVNKLLELLLKQQETINTVTDPFALFPKEFPFSFPRAILEKSLKNEILLVKSAREVKDEIIAYLRLIEPELFSNQEQFIIDDTFFY